MDDPDLGFLLIIIPCVSSVLWMRMTNYPRKQQNLGPSKFRTYIQYIHHNITVIGVDSICALSGMAPDAKIITV